MPIPTEDTTFTRDVLGRYVCNTFNEALVTVDPAARAAVGLSARGDLRPFDFIIIGGGTFGALLGLFFALLTMYVVLRYWPRMVAATAGIDDRSCQLRNVLYGHLAGSSKIVF